MKGVPFWSTVENKIKRVGFIEGREGGYQIPVPSLNLAQISVPRLIFAKIPVTGLQFKSNKSLEFSVCITALFALTYLISSTILRETFSEAIFIFPSQYLVR